MDYSLPVQNIFSALNNNSDNNKTATRAPRTKQIQAKLDWALGTKIFIDDHSDIETFCKKVKELMAYPKCLPKIL